MSNSLLIRVIVACFFLPVCSVSGFTLPELDSFPSDIAPSFTLSSGEALSSLPPTDEFNIHEFDWFLTEIAMFGSVPAPGSSPPFIMLAGYMDTDISYQDGGTLHMLAYVMDPDSSVRNVQIYYAGMPTGVFLYDDGQSGDFGVGDGLWGLQQDIPPYTVPAGDYLLELCAEDVDGNLSDIWPYLTIH